MKNLSSVLFFTIVLLTSNAFGFQLNFTNNPDGSQTIQHIAQDWVYVDSGGSYKVYIHKDVIGRKGDNVNFHSITEFNTYEEYSGLPYKIKRIYTHGVISCQRSALMIFVDMYTDLENTIRFSSLYQNGEFLVDMNETSLRKQITYMVCGDSI
jgi:hypothetical protein